MDDGVLRAGERGIDVAIAERRGSLEIERRPWESKCATNFGRIACPHGPGLQPVSKI